MKHARTRGWRGSMVAYAASFVALVVSTYVLFEGNTKSDMGLVRISIGLSAVALVVAVASVLFSRR